MLTQTNKVAATLFITEDKKNKIYKEISIEDIILITTNKGRVPIFYTDFGECVLLTKLSQIKDFLELNFNFVQSDRGTLINLDRMKEYDASRNIITFCNGGDLIATVSENRRGYFESLNLNKKNK